MDIFDALTKHHDELREIMQEVADKPSLFPKLKKHLTIHHEVEEAVLYEHMKKDDDVRGEALEATEEHRYIEMMVIDVFNFPKDNERWPIKFHVMQEYVEHHLDEEEEEAFPEGREAIDEKTAEEMGKRFIERLEKRLSC